MSGEGRNAGGFSKKPWSVPACRPAVRIPTLPPGATPDRREWPRRCRRRASPNTLGRVQHARRPYSGSRGICCGDHPGVALTRHLRSTPPPGALRGARPKTTRHVIECASSRAGNAEPRLSRSASSRSLWSSTSVSSSRLPRPKAASARPRAMKKSVARNG